VWPRKDNCFDIGTCSLGLLMGAGGWMPEPVRERVGDPLANDTRSPAANAALSFGRSLVLSSTAVF